MLRMIIGGNHKLVTSITSKIVTRCFRKNLGCKSAKITCNDITIDNAGEDMMVIHFNGDLLLSKEELLRILDSKMEVGE